MALHFNPLGRGLPPDGSLLPGRSPAGQHARAGAPTGSPWRRCYPRLP